jgi:hypothetical protein
MPRQLAARMLQYQYRPVVAGSKALARREYGPLVAALTVG